MLTDDLAALALPPAKDIIILIADALALGPAYSGNQLNKDNLPNFYELAANYPIVALNSCNLSELDCYRTIATGKWFNEPRQEVSDQLKSKTWIDFWRHYKKQETDLRLLAIWDGDEGENTKLLIEFLETVKRKKITNVAIMLSVAENGLAESEWLKKYLKGDWPATITVLAGSNWFNNNNRDWNKTSLSYQAVVLGLGTTTQSFDKYWAMAGADLAPVIAVDSYGQPLGLLDNDDVVVCLGYSSLNWRQLLSAIIKEKWFKFDRLKTIKATWFSNRVEAKDLLIEILAPDKKLINKMLIAPEDTAIVADSYKLASMNYGWLNNVKPASLMLLDSSAGDEEKISEAKKRTQELLELNKKIKIINLSWLEQAGRSGSMEEIVKQIKLLDEFIAWLSEKVLISDSCLLVTSTYGWIDGIWDERSERFNWQKNNNKLPLLMVVKSLAGKTLGSGEAGGDLNSLSVSGDLTTIGKIVPVLLGGKNDTTEKVL